MEIKVVTKEKNCMELDLEGADENVLYPLITRLNEDPTVVEAKYTKDWSKSHPPRLLVRVKEGKPQTALKKAIKAITGEIETARKAFDKATK